MPPWCGGEAFSGSYFVFHSSASRAGTIRMIRTRVPAPAELQREREVRRGPAVAEAAAARQAKPVARVAVAPQAAVAAALVKGVTRVPAPERVVAAGKAETQAVAAAAAEKAA